MRKYSVMILIGPIYTL